jgi:hypothetical protein
LQPQLIPHHHGIIMRKLAFAALIASSAFSVATHAATIQITEWMYNPVGSPGEFVELTNLGASKGGHGRVASS